MKCMHCRGKMKKGQAPFHIDRKGYHLSLEAVPGCAANAVRRISRNPK